MLFCHTPLTGQHLAVLKSNFILFLLYRQGVTGINLVANYQEVVLLPPNGTPRGNEI
jgi:hypothetical protein